MHTMNVLLILGLILGVAIPKISSRGPQLQGDDLTAAKELLTRNLDKLPGSKLNVVTWLFTESSTVSGTLYKYIVDVSNGSNKNECTFKIWQTLSEIQNYNKINMICQGGLELNQNFLIVN